MRLACMVLPFASNQYSIPVDVLPGGAGGACSSFLAQQWLGLLQMVL